MAGHHLLMKYVVICQCGIMSKSQIHDEVNGNLLPVHEFDDAFMLVYASDIPGDGVVGAARLVLVRQEILNGDHRML